MSLETTEQAADPRRHRRRNYFVNRPFQTRFILQFLLLVLLGCGLFGISVYFYAHQGLTTAFVHSRLRVMSTSDFLLPALGLTALIVTALITVAAGLRLLLFSHQIAGPLYRLQKTAKQIGQGDLNLHVTLRARDQLQELANSMEEMVRDLRLRLQKIKCEAERLREVSREISYVNGVPDELSNSLKDIQTRLDEQVGQFQV